MMDNEEMKDREPQANHMFPTLYLLKHYLTDKINERGGIIKIAEPATEFSQEILRNPQLLEITDQSSLAYTGGGCVNQPVAGLVEIANMAFIDSFPTIPQKLEKCKILIALNLILINIKEFKTPSGDMIGDRIQVELSNALLIEVHKRLLTQKVILDQHLMIGEKVIISHKLLSKKYPSLEKK